jgi:cell division protein FtsX
MCGIVSGVFTIVLLSILAYYSDVAIVKFAGLENANDFGLTSSVLLKYLLSNMVQIFSIIMGSGIVLGALSSYLAVRRYLKV